MWVGAHALAGTDPAEAPPVAEVAVTVLDRQPDPGAVPYVATGSLGVALPAIG